MSESKIWIITLTRTYEYEVEARSKLQAIVKSHQEFDAMPPNCHYQSIGAEIKEEEEDWKMTKGQQKLLDDGFERYDTLKFNGEDGAWNGALVPHKYGPWVDFNQAELALQMAREYKRDAERYRWLKGKIDTLDDWLYNPKGGYMASSANSIDQYIDQQIEKESNG